MNATCEGSNQKAGYDSGTEAWSCQECGQEFHRREIQPGALVPVHSCEAEEAAIARAVAE